MLRTTTCFAESSPVAELPGEWFDWRVPHWDRPALVIQADGTGVMRGHPIKWSYDEASQVVVFTHGDGVTRWHYGPKEKSLVLDDGGENAERKKRGEVAKAMPVLIKADSPMRIWQPEANKRPDGTAAEAPPSNPSQGAAVPHP